MLLVHADRRRTRVPAGSEVRTRITGAASDRVAPLIGTFDTRVLTGSVVENNAGTMVLEVPTGAMPNVVANCRAAPRADSARRRGHGEPRAAKARRRPNVDLSRGRSWRESASVWPPPCTPAEAVRKKADSRANRRRSIEFRSCGSTSELPPVTERPARALARTGLCSLEHSRSGSRARPFADARPRARVRRSAHPAWSTEGRCTREHVAFTLGHHPRDSITVAASRGMVARAAVRQLFDGQRRKHGEIVVAIHGDGSRSQGWVARMVRRIDARALNRLARTETSFMPSMAATSAGGRPRCRRE